MVIFTAVLTVSLFIPGLPARRGFGDLVYRPITAKVAIWIARSMVGAMAKNGWPFVLRQVA